VGIKRFQVVSFRIATIPCWTFKFLVIFRQVVSFPHCDDITLAFLNFFLIDVNYKREIIKKREYKFKKLIKKTLDN